MGARSSLLLPTKQSLCELRLLTGDGLGTTHYLSDCGKHLIARGGESPGRLVETGAKRYLTKSDILEGIILIIQITKKGSPRARLGGPEVLVL